jgi:prevent-host-death family protein
MSTITLEEAQGHLADVIAKLTPGEPVIITRNGTPVARLVAEEPPRRQPRKPGSGKGKLIILSDDDEHLKDFAEYMP